MLDWLSEWAGHCGFPSHSGVMFRYRHWLFLSKSMQCFTGYSISQAWMHTIDCYFGPWKEATRVPSPALVNVTCAWQQFCLCFCKVLDFYIITSTQPPVTSLQRLSLWLFSCLLPLKNQECSSKIKWFFVHPTCLNSLTENQTGLCTCHEDLTTLLPLLWIQKHQ